MCCLIAMESETCHMWICWVYCTTEHKQPLFLHKFWTGYEALKGLQKALFLKQEGNSKNNKFILDYIIKN